MGADPHPAYDNVLRHLGSIRYAGERRARERDTGETARGGAPNLPLSPPNVSPPGQSAAIPSFSIAALLPPRLDLFYRYNGSLTTPPCYQSVLWTLFQQPVRISRAQVGLLGGNPPTLGSQPIFGG